jgi:two-component sensor histidine kinase
MGVLRDITEIKKAETELKNSIHQKEILLKEVHHRVKNNLQVISSILNLQTGYIIDEDTLGVIRECQDRIKSMAFIHESLYQKEDFAAVNFSEYLHNLCSNILHSYRTPNRNISFDFEIEDISLSLDSAIPCGLIVNELVSNCFKYAFKSLKQGKIKVTLTKDKHNNKCLTVHDSGKGLPKDLNIKTNDSLGLQLVWMLVDQIDGEIRYEYASGSKFIVDFKRD